MNTGIYKYNTLSKFLLSAFQLSPSIVRDLVHANPFSNNLCFEHSIAPRTHKSVSDIYSIVVYAVLC